MHSLVVYITKRRVHDDEEDNVIWGYRKRANSDGFALFVCNMVQISSAIVNFDVF